MPLFVPLLFANIPFIGPIGSPQCIWGTTDRVADGICPPLVARHEVARQGDERATVSNADGEEVIRISCTFAQPLVQHDGAGVASMHTTADTITTLGQQQTSAWRLQAESSS